MSEIKIKDIIVLKGNIPTDAGSALMEAVHEGIGFKVETIKIHNCNAEYDCNDNTDLGVEYCTDHCKEYSFEIIDRPLKYLTSLDAWRPIWDKMSDEQKEAYLDGLIQMSCNNTIQTDFYFEIYPHHHLEAIAGVLEVECRGCAGVGRDVSYKDVPVERDNPDIINCPHCQGTGKRTILDIWEDKWK